MNPSNGPYSGLMVPILRANYVQRPQEFLCQKHQTEGRATGTNSSQGTCYETTHETRIQALYERSFQGLHLASWTTSPGVFPVLPERHQIVCTSLLSDAGCVCWGGGVGSIIHRQDQSPVTDARQAGHCQLLTSPSALPVPLPTISVGTRVAVGGGGCVGVCSPLPSSCLPITV